jgi:hypothetical protein
MLWGRFFMNRPHHCLLSPAIFSACFSLEARLELWKKFPNNYGIKFLGWIYRDGDLRF